MILLLDSDNTENWPLVILVAIESRRENFVLVPVDWLSADNQSTGQMVAQIWQTGSMPTGNR